MRLNFQWLLVFAVTASLGCGSSGSPGGNDGGTGGDSGPLSVCGDGLMEGTEQCDDGNTTSGDGCDFECFVEDTTCGDGNTEGREECDGESNCFPAGHVDECKWEPSAYRMNDLRLLDPAIYSGPAPISTLVNNILSEAAREDYGTLTAMLISGAPDGLIDLGFVLAFSPLDQNDGVQTSGSFVTSDCNALDRPSPEPNPTPCAPTRNQELFESSFTVTTQTSGTCLETLEDTTGPVAMNGPFAVTPVTAGDHGCWVTAPFDFEVILGSVTRFPLTQTRIAAQWDATPAANVVNGLIRGFLTLDDAEAITIDEGTALIGGLALATAFGVSRHFDENGPNGATGYWVYLSFSAEGVPWKGGLMCGDGDLDAGRPAPLGSEICDPAIASGEEGACEELPFACDDGSLCTDEVLIGGDPCTAYCDVTLEVQRADGCCTAEEFAGEGGGDTGAFVDPDCTDRCGDMTVDSFEDCDTGILEGEGACDTEGLCDDGDVCTTDGISPFNDCVCFHNVLISPVSDGCCRPRCLEPDPPANCSNDPDCSA